MDRAILKNRETIAVRCCSRFVTLVVKAFLGESGPQLQKPHKVAQNRQIDRSDAIDRQSDVNALVGFEYLAGWGVALGQHIATGFCNPNDSFQLGRFVDSVTEDHRDARAPDKLRLCLV